MDDAAEHAEQPDSTRDEDLVAEIRDLLGIVPPQVVERASEARRPHTEDAD